MSKQNNWVGRPYVINHLTGLFTCCQQLSKGQLAALTHSFSIATYGDLCMLGVKLVISGAMIGILLNHEHFWKLWIVQILSKSSRVKTFNFILIILRVPVIQSTNNLHGQNLWNLYFKNMFMVLWKLTKWPQNLNYRYFSFNSRGYY